MYKVLTNSGGGLQFPRYKNANMILKEIKMNISFNGIGRLFF